ncbi:MAG TPA: Glu/Leu/Phe/Val dehydrogenase dimerization domain-containing protein [Pyrinomonadaceae bacterium]|jgi:leucine dehydrogenase
MARLEIIDGVGVETEGATLSAEIDELRQMADAWEGLRVVAHYDRPTGSWVLIAMHDETLGPSAGGSRMCVYPRTSDALRDAMRLAEAMTYKWAVVDFHYGGGKAVLSIPRPLEEGERRGLLDRFGLLLEKLGGQFSTGEDLGTTPADMARLAQVTRYVHGLDRSTGELIEPGPYTALGIKGGIGAALAHRYGDAQLKGRTVLVQGLGHVGAPLAHMLRSEGAELILSDTDEGRMRALAQELECRFVAPALVYETPCDVYAPCAMGGTLSERSAPTLACAVVAGAANNQLENVGVADALHERGILYAPDYVINAGGAIGVSMRHRGATDREARARVEAIAATLRQIFDEAARQNESPLHAAQRKAQRTLAKARDEGRRDEG